ncbi:unnamed protein product [Owenia fusiformis]|uniref:C-type lectin domain-containing protein n=1 Tax=Owenia fusiformis TaxID=6347 RepID=A0A8S4PWB9_OWEFU|nr:unnamed protein product [Owenia fusiformis]
MTRILLCVAVIILGTVQGAQDTCNRRSVCPLNFIYNPDLGSCYNFVTSDKITWYDALSVCSMMDANLAAIETQAELDYLRREIKGRGFVGNSHPVDGDTFFVGGILFNGGWQWIGGPSWKTKPISFAPWRPNQPNALNVQKCVILYGGDDFLFHNWNCDYKLYYICEMKVQ